MYLVDLVDAAKEGLARVHLHEDAAEGPHVDGHGVGQAQHHLSLWWFVVVGLVGWGVRGWGRGLGGVYMIHMYICCIVNNMHG